MDLELLHMKNHKIKNLFVFWGMVLSLGILAACDPVYEMTNCPSYVVCYVNLETIELSAESSNPQCIVIEHGNDLPIISYGLRSTGTEKEKYDELCKKHNDLSYNQYRYLPTGPAIDYDSVTYNECDFTGISVTCDKAFDETHPAGKNLSDIVRFMSMSPYRYILSGYSEYYNYNESDVSDAFDTLMRIYINKDYFDSSVNNTCYPIDELLKDLTAENLTLNGYDAPGFIGMLYFERKPSEPGEYSITVNIKTDDGRDLSDTILLQF